MLVYQTDEGPRDIETMSREELLVVVHDMMREIDATRNSLRRIREMDEYRPRWSY